MAFVLVLFVFSVASFLFGILVQLCIRKIYIVAGVTLIGWLIATFVFFDSSFLLWAFMYSILSLAGSGIIYAIRKPRNT